ncbi:MAG: phenylacetate--CoA ligase family protein [Myxococcales bacterium]|nr:phenylacetate--CoA ligase family protein [Myxococcales bacterium]
MSDLYGGLFRKLLFPAWEGVIRSRPTLKILADLQQTEWRGADEILAAQGEALARLITHAYTHVPWYRARLDEAGVRPDAIRAPADLARLPLLTRADARAAGDARCSTAPPRATIRKATSGTMGQPLAFGYDAGSEHWRQATKLRGYGWAGYRPGDRSLHYWGASALPAARLPAAKVAIDRRLRRETYLNCSVRSDAELARVVESIRRHPPDALLCFTQAGGDLARYIVANGLRSWGTIPVLCGAERLYDADRQALIEAFGPSVFETYGCREVMLIASECERHDGLHVSAENLIVELLVTDGERRREALPGETGEVVITDLHNLGMPFIRYANGDLAVAGPAGRCACGRALPRITSVEGRVTETLRDGQGRKVSGLVFNVLFAGVLAASVRQFQAVQHRDGSITLRLVPTHPLDDGAREQIRATCARYLEGVLVRTEVVEEIPPTKGGKRQVVVIES